MATGQLPRDNIPSMQTATLAANLDRLERQFEAVVAAEFPRRQEIYLNTGSSGRKPTSVLQAVAEGTEKLNINPTRTIFVDTDHYASARHAAARVLHADEKRLLLQNNTNQAMHFILSNLLGPGDELVITNQEHGSVNAISRLLEETRGVTTRRVEIDPFKGSANLCESMLAAISAKTRVVLVSEIGCYTGWRPDLRALQAGLPPRVELVIDGAHTPGQRDCDLTAHNYRFWVGSGHKWLGAPSGTGFALLPPDVVPRFQPLLLDSEHYTKKDADAHDITRFETQGTSDVVKWWGLAAACDLFTRVGVAAVEEYQLALAQYFREEVEKLRPQFRTANLYRENLDEATSMVVCYWPRERLLVEDLREALWEKHKLWVQPDFLSAVPGHGLRVACHYSNNKADIDLLLEALSAMVKS